MSMPSDVTSDITEAVENSALRNAQTAVREPSDGSLRLTREQSGVAIAAVIAFVGVAFLGPALGRALEKQKRLEARLAHRARDARHRARAVGKQARRRLRRLGDETFRR